MTTCPHCGGGGSVREGTRWDDTPYVDCPTCHGRGSVTDQQARAWRIAQNRARMAKWHTEALADRADDDAAMRDDREDRAVWLGWESAR